MPRKAFIADLSEAIEDSAVPGISNVRKGGDDGEFVFTLDTGSSSQSVELTANISDVSDYPTTHLCFFIAPDNAPASIADKLGGMFDQTMGKTVQQLLQLVLKATRPRLDHDHDVEMVDSQADSDFDDQAFDQDDSEEEPEDYFPDEMLSLQLPTQTGHNSAQSTVESTSPFRARIRSDLLTAKVAGFKVGALGQLLEGGPSFVTLSILIGKLGISTEAMQAWQVKPSEYLVLILSYPIGYHSMDDLMKLDSDSCRRALSMRVVVGNTYKPTIQEAVYAFTQLAKEESKDQATSNTPSDPSSLHLGFRNSFISGPLNEFMNDRLVKLLTYRYSGMSWGGAEEFLSDHMASTNAHSDLVDEKYMAEEHLNGAFPRVVTADHLQDASTTQQHSFPLMAMQCLLRHFVRCTEFCLVCFRKMPDDLEAIKPYVCDNPLCLYQYMSLGFGPSIEHEILAQPNVVDLLISFCYTSARSGALKSFPSGLSLMVPPASASVVHPFDSQEQMTVKGMSVKYDHAPQQMIFESDVRSCPFKIGDWLVMRIRNIDTPLHARITETTYFPTVAISDFVYHSPVNPDLLSKQPAKQENKGPSSPPAAKPTLNIALGPQTVSVWRYDQNFDDLVEWEKTKTICDLLDIVPSVPEMRSYLCNKNVTSLSGWVDRLSPAIVGLLRWIIASSRACILEAEADNGDKNRRDERVYGMNGWVQFRFAMGAPDKERRFINAVRTTSQRKSLTFPTLYAWHGSPLSNWHSIIREGLHFKTVSHGRAYGDGVYHSLNFNTSMGYSSMFGSWNGGGGNYGPNQGYWPQSELKVGTALALNEIVNAPDEYTSRNPHLVVQHVDWIQTRYLFIKTHSGGKIQDVAKPSEFHPQDPNMTPDGMEGKLIIPMKSSTKKKRPTPLTQSLKSGIKRLKGSGRKSDPITLDGGDDVDFDDSASVQTLPEDLEILQDEEPVATPVVKGNSGVSAKPQTDFVPGELQADSLERLAEPQWASISATKRLQQDFKALLKVQAREPLHELGWYIDPDLISNMYQWIIELHSFEPHLPLAKDMKSKDLKSIVLELRFGKDYPMSPPFVRVVRPRFLDFNAGGGGHVTAGGALCMELLTNNGWSAVSSIESVLLQVRLAMSSTDRPAKLAPGAVSNYRVGEAVEAYIRACANHGWTVPPGFREMAYGGSVAEEFFTKMDIRKASDSSAASSVTSSKSPPSTDPNLPRKRKDHKDSQV